MRGRDLSVWTGILRPQGAEKIKPAPFVLDACTAEWVNRQQNADIWIELQ